LGYALTIHKTQGNQFDYVFIPMINSFYIMLNNKLMYTAITRAKKKAILVGQITSFKRACKNIDSTVRNTWLILDNIENTK
jgi:exodeoxyribonuclease V alpha subunit